MINKIILDFLPYFSRNFRKKRFKLFQSLFLQNNKKIKILDVGGTQEFWEPYIADLEDCQIIILNLVKIPVTLTNFKSVVGDGRNMEMFKDKEFDVVFSNSVIEHVGDWEDQKKMAKEIQRVGKHYFVQTPNYYFPIEPHFFFPFYQFLPLSIKVFLIQHFRLGWRLKTSDYQKAVKMVSSVRLLLKSENSRLFPYGNIYEEQFFSIVKSFILYR